MPNYGGVDFGPSSTNWTATDAAQVDYFIAVAGKPAAASAETVSRDGPSDGEQIMHAFVDAVGHSPVLPEWGVGYWHSKNRYATQQQITVRQTFFCMEKSFSCAVIKGTAFCQ